MRPFTGTCPACAKPIEPGNVITCASCWQLIPAHNRHKLRRWYQARNEATLNEAIKRVVRVVRVVRHKLSPKPVAATVPEGAEQPEQ